MPIYIKTTPTSIPSIVTSGLVLNLDASNASSYPGSGTTWTNLIGNGNNATLVNSPTYSSNSGGYLSFNGSNQYANLTTPSLLPTGSQVTFGVWSYGISATQTYLFNATYGGNIGNRTISLHAPFSDQTIYWDCGDSGGGGNTYDRISINVGTGYQGWHYWVYTKNTTTGVMNIYKDSSVLQTGTGKTKSISTSTAARIAANSTTVADFWTGYIAQVQIYNTELSAADVLQNYNATKTRFGL